jgi:hypothetical protein
VGGPYRAASHKERMKKDSARASNPQLKKEHETEMACVDKVMAWMEEGKEAGAYTRPLSSSTQAVLVTPPRVPLSNKLGENDAPNVSHRTCSR